MTAAAKNKPAKSAKPKVARPRKPAKSPEPTVKSPSPRVLVLRTCDASRKSHNKFQWPESGPVACCDWKPKAECGNGLHGLLWGEGNGELLDWSPDATWLVVSVEADSIVDLDDKVKFPRGEVVHCGDRLSATSYLAANGGHGRSIAGGTATAGYSGTATAGYSGTATAGDSGTATAGYRGTATAGDSGTATAGDSGTATAGDSGTATAGYSGTATAGYRGTATAGYRGTIAVKWWDSSAQRFRTAIGYIGEDGLKPEVAYRWEDEKWVEAKP